MRSSFPPWKPTLNGRLWPHPLHAKVRREIDRLPENLRDTLLLASGGDLDYETIASMLGVREGTIKSRVHEARALLRSSLEDASR